MIKKKFRDDYVGEFVVLETMISNSVSIQKREWIANPVVNKHISGRAAVICSRVDKKKLPWNRLHKHKGGLLGTKKLQTYGSGDFWKDMRFDFFVSKNQQHIQEMVSAKYTETTVCYTTPKLCLQYPGNFFVVPYLPALDVIAIPIYLAAFDSHREVFCIGLDVDVSAGTRQWTEDINLVFSTYDSTQFYLVTDGNLPEIWIGNPNVKPMSYRQFIFYCDI